VSSPNQSPRTSQPEEPTVKRANPLGMKAACGEGYLTLDVKMDAKTTKEYQTPPGRVRSDEPPIQQTDDGEEESTG